MTLAITEADAAHRRASAVMEAYARGDDPRNILTDKEMMGSLAMKLSDFESNYNSRGRASSSHFCDQPPVFNKEKRHKKSFSFAAGEQSPSVDSLSQVQSPVKGQHTPQEKNTPKMLFIQPESDSDEESKSNR